MVKMCKYTAWLLILCTVFLFVGPTAQAAQLGNTYISAKGACLLDFESGEVLYAHNANEKYVPASMTKVMTVYLVYEAIANRQISMDTIVPISTRIHNMSANNVYQRVQTFSYNGNYTVDEMLDVTLVYSSTAAASALAELVGGSEQQFVAKMNQKAKELGLSAVYYDSCGLANNLISPLDMAKLARALIRDYPEVLEKTSKQSVTFRGVRYPTTNKLISTYKYSGADGLKTGTTSASGYCFCGTAKRGDVRVIAVAMGASSTSQRFSDVMNMMDYGFKAINGVYFTDMRTFIDGNEMPMFYCKAQNQAVVIAEDLKDYGFDTYYDAATNTFYAQRNAEKAATPIPMQYYHGKNGVRFVDYAGQKPCTVVITDGDKVVSTEAYRIGNYTYLWVDVLQQLYPFTWDNAQRAVLVQTAA